MSEPAAPITWADFERVDLRVGTIVEAHAFPEARKPAIRLLIDLGPELGLKKSSAQLCVVNFPPRQIGPMRSEVLVTGAADAEGRIVLASFAAPLPNGSRLI
jgi:tRNA-binding protein